MYKYKRPRFVVIASLLVLPFSERCGPIYLRGDSDQVDIDQALSGIDKLLKSQELTFAFVGVAPALAVVYGFAGYAKSLWVGGRGRGVYGGRKRRVRVWLAMRCDALAFSCDDSYCAHIYVGQED